MQVGRWGFGAGAGGEGEHVSELWGVVHRQDVLDDGLGAGGFGGWVVGGGQDPGVPPGCFEAGEPAVEVDQLGVGGLVLAGLEVVGAVEEADGGTPGV